MTELSLLLPTGSSSTAVGHTSRTAAALLQESLHGSRRATFTREFGEIRGIHRLSAPTATAELVDNDASEDLVSSATQLAVVDTNFRKPPTGMWQEALRTARGGEVEGDRNREDAVTVPTEHTETQLRGLIHDFKERQRKAGLVVAGSVASAVVLTIATITLIFAIAA